jgi:Flp pilus assembly protein TadG
MRQRGRRFGAHPERGATLVEFALIAPLLFLILFGIVEFGLVLNDFNSLRQGTRDAAREGIVGDVGTTDCADLVGVTGAGASSTATRRLLCQAKTSIGISDRNRVRVKLRFGTGGYADKQPLVLCAQHQPKSLTGLFSPFIDNKRIKSKVQMRIEKVVTPGLAEAQEAAPVGGDWAWCTVSS